MIAAAATRYLTIEELCTRLNITLRTARYWRTKGKGPRPVKMGRELRYPIDRVERYEAELRGESDEDGRGQNTA